MKRLVSAFLVLAFIAVGVLDANAAGIRTRVRGRAVNDYAGSTWLPISGLKVFGAKTKVFVQLDTVGSSATGTAAWTLTRAAGSTATLDSSAKFTTSFTADTVGFYYLTVGYGTYTHIDTLYASTYVGVPDLDTPGCTNCHNPGGAQDLAYQSWKNTGHAQIFRQGISGLLELTSYRDANAKALTQGSYGKTCMSCHTVGYQVGAANGNFGYLAHATIADTSHTTNPNQRGWDSTWYAGLIVSGTSLYPVSDTGMARWKAMPATLQGLGSIGCESCHGPLNGHANVNGSKIYKVAVSYQTDVCNMCHNGSSRHNTGKFYNLSLHATYPPIEPQSGCAPCHMGAGFVKWVNNGHDTTGFSKLTTEQLYSPISCQTCHDPHKASTITGTSATGPVLDPGLRNGSVDSLGNGYKYKPAGKSQVCSYCHSARSVVSAMVKPASAPYYGIKARFNPHHNPQMDMLQGSGGYEFGDSTLKGLSTHAGLEDGCVTCHMQVRPNGMANHSMMMAGDTIGGFSATKVCSGCHGEIVDFNDVKAFYDFDRNGKIEGVQTEVQGLLTKVAAILPKDTTNVLIATKSTLTKADSLKYSGRLDLVAATWNYNFVLNDASKGVHNAAYAVRLLYKSLSWTPLWVKDYVGTTPAEYKLDQNYPNPFNPSTVIRFSLPKETRVRLDVYDVTGQLVKSLLNEGVRAGNKEITWDGTNNKGAKVSTGVYIYRLAADNFVSSKKMVLIK